LVAASLGVAPIFLDGCNTSSLRYEVTGATTSNGSGSIAGIALNKGVNNIAYNLSSSTSDKCTFKVTVIDNEAPKITLTPTVVIDACTIPNPIPNTFRPTILDNCSTTNTLTVLSDVEADVSGCSTKTAAQKYTKLLTRTWLASDGNGNSSTAIQRIYLRDMTPPIAVCQNITVSIGTTNTLLPASSLNSSSNDNCSAANALTFVACINVNCTNYASTLTLTRAMIPAGATSANITVMVRARDACGNLSAPASAIITLKLIGTLGNTNTSNSIAVSDSEAMQPTDASDIPTLQGDMKCFPNPFTEDLNIQYNLNEDVEQVTLKVFDNHGRLVTKMEQEAQLKGFYQVRWNLSDILQSGMYHVCLELNGKCTKIERVVMLK
jgi:hypothetical protein